MTAEPVRFNPDERLEVVTIPVSDVERAKEFYLRLGWRLDRTPPAKVQVTSPGSACSVQFGAGLTTAEPGSAQNMYLCVPDIVAERNRLVELGVEVGDYYHTGGPVPEPGLHPERESYRSHFPFRDGPAPGRRGTRRAAGEHRRRGHRLGRVVRRVPGGRADRRRRELTCRTGARSVR